MFDLVAERQKDILKIQEFAEKMKNENEALRSELTRTRMIIGAIAKQNGGTISIFDSTILEMEPGDSLIVNDDPEFKMVVVSYLSEKSKTETSKKTKGG